MCSNSKNPYPWVPPPRSSEILRGSGVLRAKILEAMYESKLGGGGLQNKKPSMGEFDVFWNCKITTCVLSRACQHNGVFIYYLEN